jgi:predicted MFS family arabinose efflux permease
MTDSMKLIYSKGQEVEVNRIASGVYVAFHGLGQCLGPIYGAFAFKRLGFPITSDILAVLTLLFALLYFFLVNGYRSIK